jgi:hypothetical protein
MGGDNPHPSILVLVISSIVYTFERVHDIIDGVIVTK